MGEWSAASTDCAKWLNQRNTGARWDGTYTAQPNAPLGTCANVTGDSSGWTNDYKTFLRKCVSFSFIFLYRISVDDLSRYWEVQSVLGDAVQGNVWWTWKVRNSHTHSLVIYSQ
jgi:hypothetical protein